ncbi:hypothetical protein [Pseudoalteromonas sp. PA2MD11]|uniref:hypothetical protein n=1 Tax=Pseudoalteromonas sp. PA2MD11 TaxID=2785057 RepID=UPI001AE0A606|nr:hypothetical protein [Pseudoalteromonas sp. PA2MD11]
MAKSKIYTYLDDLVKQKHLHPCYQEIEQAYLKHGGDFEENYTDIGLSDLYGKICELLFRYFKKCSTKYCKHQFKKIQNKLKTDLATRQLQLKIISGIFNYGEAHYGIKALNVSSIVELKKDKPIIVPTSMTMLPVAIDLIEIIQAEIRKPSQDLGVDAEYGRLALFILLTTDIRNPHEISEIINQPENVIYGGGLTLWLGSIKSKSRRYLLCDVVALLIFKLQSKANFELLPVYNSTKTNNYLKSFLYHHSDTELGASSITFAKVKKLRKLAYITYLSPLLYLMYFQVNLAVTLSETSFLRLLTGRAISTNELLELEHDSSLTSEIDFLSNVNSIYTPASEIKTELELVYSELKQKEKQLSRAKLILDFKQVLNKNKNQNVYQNLLMLWLYHLLKNGGVNKQKLKVNTVIDYVKSVSHPFLIVFTSCDYKHLKSSDWENQLNEAANYFSSGQRRKYLYYFADFLKGSGIVQGLSVDNLDVASTKANVSANIISAQHITATLEYLYQRYLSQLETSSPFINLDYLYAYLLLCFCFYSGLRRNEAAKLYISDLDFSPIAPENGEFDWCRLSVRPNKFRALKSASARRDIPLDGLWPREQLKILRAFYQELKNNNHKRALLFNCQSTVDRSFELITHLLQHYCQDYTIKVHHLRHSFANWTWCRMNSNLLDEMKLKFEFTNDVLFESSLNERFQYRLKLKSNTRSKMFVLSHLMGHKSVTTTLSSYMHLKDIWLYIELNSQFSVSKKFLNECFRRAKLEGIEQNNSLVERIKFYSKNEESSISALPWDQFFKYYIHNLPNFNDVDDGFKTMRAVSLIDYGKILNALEINSPFEIAQVYGVSVKHIIGLYENAKKVHKMFPEFGKKLPVIPHFPNFNVSPGDQDKKKPKGKTSYRAFVHLCNKADELFKSNKLTLVEVYHAVKILKYAAAGKSFAIRSPDLFVNEQFLILCSKLNLKDRHFNLKFHRGELTASEATKAKQVWEQLKNRVGYKEAKIKDAALSESRYLQNSAGHGYFEIAVLISRKSNFKREQRHHSLFSFFHLLLILSFQSE